MDVLAPPPGVTSINGQRGIVALDSSDVGSAPVYNLASYGGAPGGVVDNTDAMTAAYTAFKAGGGYGKIVMGPGVWLFNKEAYPCLTWDGNHVGRLIVEGAGDGATIVKFGSLSQRMFVWASFAGGGASFSGNWGNITIQNLTVDNNNLASYAWGMQGVVFNFSRDADLYTSLRNVRIRNVSTRNVPRQASGVPFRESVSIECGVFNNTEAAATPEITDIIIEDFDFGSTGNGGNYGIKIQCFDGRSSSTTVHSGEYLRNGQYRTGTFFDRIVIRPGRHYGGPAQTFFNPCSNIIIGSHGHGGRVHVDGFFGKLSGDDGIEINSFLDIVISNSEVQDTFSGNAGLFFANLGGMPEPERQILRVQNCRLTTTATNSSNGSNNNAGIGITRGASSVAPHGHIIIEDTFLDHTSIFVGTDFKTFTLRNVHYAQNRDITISADGYSSQSFPVTITQTAGAGKLIVDGLHCVSDLTIDNSGNYANTFHYYGALSIRSTTDLVLDVKNVTVNPLFKLLGTGQVRGSLLPIGAADASAVINFSGTSSTNGRYMWDAGTKADVLVSGGVLTPQGDYTTERRFLPVEVGGDFWTSSVGKHTDGGFIAEFKPGTTVTGFKAGIVAKSQDALNYGEGYVYDDGTNSYLCLDKIVVGTRTSVLPASTNGGAETVTDISSPPSNVSDRGIRLTTRLTTGTSLWVRTKIQYDTMTVDYSTSALSSAAGSGNTTASATITSVADIDAFGHSRQGYGGIVWVPISADATVDVVRYLRMNVLSGTVDGVQLLHGVKADQSFGGVSTSGVAASTRIRGALNIENVDVMKWTTVVTTSRDVSIADPTIGVIRQRNIFGPNSVVDHIPAFRGSHVSITGNHTLKAIDSGSMHVIDSPTDVDITIPQDLPIDWTGAFIQRGTGVGNFVTTGNATIVNRLGYGQTAGEGAGVSLYVGTNSDGNHAEATLFGDGAV